MATRVVGFDIGSRHVRAVVLETSLRGFSVVELVEERITAPAYDDVRLVDPDTAPEENPTEVPSDTDEPIREPLLHPGAMDAIQRILQRPGFEFDAVFATTPEGSFYTTAIELPPAVADDKKIRAILPAQLDGKLPEDVDELHFDYMRAGKTAQNMWRVYAGGISHERMGEFVSEWEEVGLSPRVVDVQPFPLFTVSEWLLGPSTDARATIDIGAEYTRVIITRAGSIELARVLQGGSEAVTRAIATALQISEDDAREIKHRDVQLRTEDTEELSDEARALNDAAIDGLRNIVRDLRRTFTAHAATAAGPVASAYVCGAGAALKGLNEALSSALSAPVSTLPAKKDELSRLPNIQTLAPRFATAMGVALRGTSVSPASTFNLRRGQWAFRGAYEYITSRLPALLAMGGALILSLAFFLFARSALLKAEFNAVDDALAELSRQVLGAEFRDPDLVQTRLNRGVEGHGLHPELSAYDIVVRVSKAAQVTVDSQMPMEITGVDVDMSRRQAKVSGVCDSANIAESFGRNLQGDTCLQNVQRSSLTQRSSDSRFEFSFTATVNCRATEASTAEAPAESEAAEP